jgi:undecaprenyl-diphosphatase
VTVRVSVGVFLATLSTGFLPVPEEATLLGGGFAVRLGRASLAEGIGAAWLAVMLGDALAYFIGRELLGRALRTRWGARVFPEARRAWAERLVAEHGVRAIVVARFLVGLRGFVYFAVGSSRYPVGRFLLANGAAAAVEVSALVSLGFAFGAMHARVGVWLDLVAAAVLLIALFGPLFARRFEKSPS